MSLRTMVASLFLICLLISPAFASQPSGLAAKLITDLAECDDNGLPPVSGFPPTSIPFEWGEWFDVKTLDPADTVTVSMALIPFDRGATDVTMFDGTNSTFLEVHFADGLVDGLRYDRTRWNDVTLSLDVAAQSYTLTVNGAHAGPFPFAQFCADEGGCFSVEAMVLFGLSNGDGSVAWADSLSITRDSSQGAETLAGNSFDACNARPDVVGGASLITRPPQRVMRTVTGLLPLRERH